MTIRTPARAWSLRAALLAAAVFAAPAAAQPSLDGAAREMRAWLEAVDAGRYAESWHGAAAFLRESTSPEDWGSGVCYGRQPYAGSVERRALVSTKPMPRPTGMPPGEYARVLFLTGFSGGSGARELLVVRHEDGAWRVLSYFISDAPLGAPDGLRASADAPSEGAGYAYAEYQR